MGWHNNSKMPFPIRPPRSLPFPRQNPLDKQPFFCDVLFSAVAAYLILFHAQECYCLIQTLFLALFIGKMSFLGKACKSCGCSSVFPISSDIEKSFKKHWLLMLLYWAAFDLYQGFHKIIKATALLDYLDWRQVIAWRVADRSAKAFV